MVTPIKHAITVNGVDCYLETYYDFAAHIHQTHDKEGTHAYYAQEAGGRGALYLLAERATTLFEEKHKGRDWEGDYFDAIDNFLDNEFIQIDINELLYGK